MALPKLSLTFSIDEDRYLCRRTTGTQRRRRSFRICYQYPSEFATLDAVGRIVGVDEIGQHDVHAAMHEVFARKLLQPVQKLDLYTLCTFMLLAAVVIIISRK